MIPLFKKLKNEKLLKADGQLIDLGGGDGRQAMDFLKYGYQVTLVDVDEGALIQAQKNFKEIAEDGYWRIENKNIQDFVFNQKYDGIIMANVLPFITDKQEIARIIKTAFRSLDESGFLYFTLFGPNDGWVTERRGKMSFYSRDESLSLLSIPPYFSSEDIGQGLTRQDKIKNWHILHFLYIK
ncbi:MAG: class I SAM-dependent methyltransferase [Candidatus Paceibacterota bacterium]